MLQINMIKHKGSALLSALFIMTLVAIIATSLSFQIPLNIYRTRLIFSYDKLNLASEGVKFWAISYLNQPKAHLIDNEQGYITHYPQNLNKIYPDIVLSGEIYDLQKKFNINNIIDKKYHQNFLNLLQNLMEKKNHEYLKALLDNIYKWELPYQPQKGQNEYISLYKKNTYNPAYQPLKSITELRLIKGVNKKNYDILLPYITALPEVTPVNINNAPKIILASLGNGLNEMQVNYILETRSQEAFKNNSQIRKVLQKLNIPMNQITAESQYFLCVVRASSAELNLVKYVILKRNKQRKKDIRTFAISESSNTL